MTKPLEYLDEQELWNNKPLLKNSLFVWDVENIPVNSLDTIKRLAKFTPQKRYAISKKPLLREWAMLLTKEGFTLFEHYPLSADAKIIHLIDTHHLCSHLILVSSDSDFVPVVKRFLEKHPVQWIMQDENKKRICMYINLTHPKLTLSTIDIKDKCKSHHKRRKKPAFYAPKYTSFANEAHWLNYFACYQAHIR